MVTPPTMPTAVVARNKQSGAKEGMGARRKRARGSVLVATYNIRDGRQEELYSTAHALRESNVDIAVLQETKNMDPEFAT